jgi:phage terminase large subunit-like protein
MAQKRIGRQEPTSKYFQPYEKSLYKEAVELYEKSGRKVFEWQAYLLERMMALNEDELWAHTKFGYAIPRRNGKNEVVAMREFWGLTKGEAILHTAHRTTTSHKAWERLVEIIESAGYVKDEDYTTLKAVGRESITFLKTKGRVEFRTRTTKGGLGEGFDLLIIDEAQEYTTDEESTLKYIVTDSDNPQTIMCGTPPTPLSSGTVFTDLRNSVLEDGIDDAAWAEWSVEEESDPHDRELWYLTNPSLGLKLTERAIANEIGKDDAAIIDFNIQRLGLWLRYNQKSAISANEWEALRVETLPNLTGKLFAGIKYGHDGANVALSIAIKTDDERIFVEAIDCQSVRNGNQWILDFLQQADVQKVVIDGASGQALLADEMKDARLKPPILPTVKEFIVANSSFTQAIYQGAICHKGQPSLTQVVTNCEKRTIGSGGGFGYKSQFADYDIALMDSVILAHWACAEAKPPKKQRIRY